MAYRIDPTRSTAVEIRRLLGEQLEAAATELRRDGGADAEAIHQARKHIKKARSLLRLARTDLGPKLVHHVQAELRQAASDLAGARDADSLVEAAERLCDVAVDDEVEAVVALRDVLVDQADAARRQLTDRQGTHPTSVALSLSRTATWLRRLPAGAEGWPAIEPGLRRQYDKGRSAFEALGDQPDVDQLHDWRKRAKDLWYHERLLRDLWPAVVKPMVSAADELAGALGADHDLGLLRSQLDEPAPWATDALGANRCRLVADVIDRERSRLQGDARRLGRRLYPDTPKAWARRHQAWWEAAVEAAAVQTAAVDRSGDTETVDRAGRA